MSYALLLLLLQGAGGEEEISNLRVFQRLAREIGTELAAALEPRPVRMPAIILRPREGAWFLEQDFASSFSLPGDGGTDSSVALEIGIVDARVTYEDVRRDGLFGPKVVDRVVTLAVRTRYAASSAPPLSGEWARSVRDTVSYDRLESLEMPGVPMTQGIQPAQGVWQGVLEPLIVVGSIGVAIVLLFAVRS